MDIEHLSHQRYFTSVIIAIVLSGMIVTIAAILGRGTLNLRGSLYLLEPTDVTVIAAVQPKLTEGVRIASIDFLRSEKQNGSERASYAYLVKLSDSTHYHVRLGYDKDLGRWALVTFEYLRKDPAENFPG